LIMPLPPCRREAAAFFAPASPVCHFAEFVNTAPGIAKKGKKNPPRKQGMKAAGN